MKYSKWTDKNSEIRRSMPTLALNCNNSNLIINTQRSKAVIKLLRNLSPRASNDKLNLPQVKTNQEKYQNQKHSNLNRNRYWGLFLVKTSWVDRYPYNIRSKFTSTFDTSGMFQDTTLTAATNAKNRNCHPLKSSIIAENQTFSGLASKINK